MGWIGAGEERFRERFQQLLLVPRRDLAQGWQLASDLGRPAVPLLWDMVQAERAHIEPRLVLLAAALLAGGPAEDERVFAWLDRRRSMLEERVLTAMWLAEGPQRPRPVPSFWSRCHGPDKTPEPILRIAVRLAAARFPGVENGDSVAPDEDPGLAAAGAYAGLPLSPSVPQRLWDLRNPVRHAELFWRGALLCGARRAAAGAQIEPDLLLRARERLALAGQQDGAVRAAAALLLLRAGELRADGPRPDWEFLQVATADADGARRLRRWLGPVPEPRDEEPRRLAVAYVLSREPAEVVADRAAWSADPRVRREVAVALAFRLLADPTPAPIDVELAEPAEWTFVRWASGLPIDRVVTIEDPALQVAARLLVAGRLPRAALQKALEDALWRWGSHPVLSVREQERLLLRDLLLVGSNTGGGKYVPHVRRTRIYRPTGIGPDDEFFDVAVALHDFLARPRLPIPAEYRLR